MFQDWTGCLDGDVPKLTCLPIVFHNVVVAALLFSGTIAVFLLVYGGIRLITSGGDAKQVAGARQILTYAIVGLVIILLSFGIIYFISYLTNVPCITNFGFNC